MAEPVVAARGLSYRYPERDVDALRDVTLELDAGGFTVLAGESGSGKSTLLRALCGLVPHFHGGDVAGELDIAGMSVRDHGPGELAGVCGTVFQDPETQVVMGGVRAELSLPLEHRGESPAAVARAVEEVALAIGVADLLDRRTDTLSGGELQRVAIAAALVHRPALLVLDEPASQLDPVAGDDLVWLLRRINEDWGTAVVIAEHRLERCLPAADRIVALDHGAIACDATPADFLDWAIAHDGALATPIARLFSLVGLRPLPTSVKNARAALLAASLPPTTEPSALAADRAGGDGGDFRAQAQRARSPSRLPPLAPSPATAPGTGRSRRGAEHGPSGRRPVAIAAEGRRDQPETGPARSHAGARFRRRRHRPSAAIRTRNLWHELKDGPAILRGIDLTVAPGERLALMGRNGAGKSTLLRHLKGLVEPTRGSVERAGAVALLLQSPGDYLIHEHAVDEAGPGALAAAGLAGRERANPRDLSGGERQRLALEVVLAGDPCATVCLDEPTRGMDRVHERALADRIRELAQAGAAAIVATHDTEFAADFADRVVLMGPGVVIADGAPAEVLAGGWHFSTEVARALDGAAGALTPEHGADLIGRELVR